MRLVILLTLLFLAGCQTARPARVAASYTGLACRVEISLETR
jgi:hypothetical protein